MPNASAWLAPCGCLWAEYSSSHCQSRDKLTAMYTMSQALRQSEAARRRAADLPNRSTLPMAKSQRRVKAASGGSDPIHLAGKRPARGCAAKRFRAGTRMLAGKFADYIWPLPTCQRTRPLRFNGLPNPGFLQIDAVGPCDAVGDRLRDLHLEPRASPDILSPSGFPHFSPVVQFQRSH